MGDPATLNPLGPLDQLTTFVLVPSCVRCGHQGLSARRDQFFRCDGCQRRVMAIEYAPTVLSRRPDRRLPGRAP